MTCDKAIRLVELLADGEANPGQRAEAQAHLENCEQCRSHYELLRGVETASEKIALPEPPEAYWQHFPAKVLDRIEREGRGGRTGFWQNIFTPSGLRLGAAAATLTVVVAVGVSVYRDDPSLLEPELSPEFAELAQAPASPGKAVADDLAVGLGDPAEPQQALGDPAEPQQERRARAESNAAPAVKAEPERAQAEQASQAGQALEASQAADADLDVLQPLERTVELDIAEEESFRDQPAAEPAGRRSNRPSRALAEEPTAPGLPEEVELAASEADDAARLPPSATAPKAARASSLRAGEAGTAVLASASDPCAEWRRYLADNGEETAETREARYQLALCSLRRYDAEPSDDTRRDAIRDAEAFLASPHESPDEIDRAEEIRLRLEPLRQ